MLRFSLLLALLVTPVFAQLPLAPEALHGRIDDHTYVAPGDLYRIDIPVLPELGGRVLDTDTTVTFQDDFNVLCSIAAVPMDATQRWELETRGTKDYLPYFFANFVLPDFQEAFPGTHVESAKFAASVAGGGLFVYALLPGGTMFAPKLSFLGADQTPPQAKRGNLIFVRNGFVFVVSIELAERITERATYKKTPEEENDLLRQRLVDILAKLRFPGAGHECSRREMSLTIRAAQPADLPAIVAIYNSIIPGRQVTADLEPVTVEARRPWFDAHPPATRPIWVAEDQSAIVAWLSFDTFYARAAYDGTAMLALYVAEHRRGSGLGTTLLARAIEQAPTLGVHTLLGYIFAHNEPSLRLFAKFGFARWAHLPRIARLDDQERDLIIVGRRLTP